MRSLFRTLLPVLGGVLLAAMAALVLCRMRFGMGRVEACFLGDPAGAPRVLLATQRSAFKDSLTGLLGERIYRLGGYAAIMDVSGLTRVETGDWDLVIILATTEAWRLPGSVVSFLERAENRRAAVFLIQTSGDGQTVTADPGVEAVSSASRNGEIPWLVQQAMSRIAP